MRTTDKFEIKRYGCKECRHLIKLLKGAKNIYGDWMTPPNYFYRIQCAQENAPPVLVQNPERRRDCPYFMKR